MKCDAVPIKPQWVHALNLLSSTLLLLQPTAQASPIIELDRMQITGHFAKPPPTSTTSHLNREAIHARGLLTTHEAARYVPGLHITQGGARALNNVFSVRGLVNAPTLGSNSVNFYLDDAPYGNAASYTHQLYGIDQLAFSRGPQGARFGKNSYAGAIRLTSRPPGQQLSGEAMARVSRFDQRTIDAWFTAPLIEQQLSFSLTAGYAQEDGILTNTFRHTHPDQRQQANGRMALLWTPTERWKLQLSSGLEHYNDGAARLTSLTEPVFEVSSDTPGTIQQDAHQQALRIEYQGDDYNLLWVGHHRRWHLHPLKVDVDLSNGPLMFQLDSTHRETQWSQELRLSSARPGDWQWQTGLYTALRQQYNRLLTRSVAGLFDARQDNRYRIDERSYAVFGGLSYTGIKAWTLHADVRLDFIQQRRDQRSLDIINPNLRQHTFFVSPGLRVEYEWSPQLNVHASSALAFKPGGFNTITSAGAKSTVSDRYSKEQLWANELGLKINWADQLLQAHLALFYYQIRDYQVEQLVNLLEVQVTTAPRARSYGAELELSYTPVEGLDLQAALAYTHATFEQLNHPETGVDLSGKRVLFTPEYTALLAAEYQHNNGFFSRAEWYYTGPTDYDAQNRSLLTQTGYSILNLRIGYRGKHFSAYVSGENLTNTHYFTHIIENMRAGVPAYPRRVGLTLGWKF